MALLEDLYRPIKISGLLVCVAKLGIIYIIYGIT